MGKFRRLKLDKNMQKSKTRLLGEICSFLDMVPLFRELATKSMGSMIEMQKGQIFELGELQSPCHVANDSIIQRRLIDALHISQSLHVLQTSKRRYHPTSLSLNGTMPTPHCAHRCTTCAICRKRGNRCLHAMFTTCLWAI